MSEPPLMPALVCQRCGATNPPHAVKCWLCEPGESSNPFAAPMLPAPAPSAGSIVTAQSPVQTVFLGLLIGCAALAVLIGVGIAAQDPGMLVPYVIVIGPAFLATGARAALTIGRKETLRPSTLLFTFLWSGLFTAMTLMLLVVASVIALGLWCLRLLTGA